ncbi:20S proteasome maturation protein Ump1 [Akanthomyces lecanii RCEF 1005]|uniref:20S proteasome maturation protein Ump1 n=1 Tax=Akanthomyces lecanii RCEF 1005 TaxID=1081108 RepID=A0A168K1A7_CORDF|nr:20S proteasome maturation protein Ump1 [Akanthomyces lecanii RCEF 1005]
MSMRFVPSSQAASSYSHTGGASQQASTSAPSAPGLHDTLRYGVGPSAYDAQTTRATSAHPLEARLKNWEATQEAVRMESLKRTFGMGEPIRRGMELKIVRDGQWRPMVLGTGLPSVHEDILRGREDTITWEDVYTGDESRGVAGFHEEMEKKCKV